MVAVLTDTPFEEALQSSSSSLESPASASGVRTTPTSTVFSFRVPGRVWYEDFRVDWSHMPQSILQAVADGVRPAPNARKDAIKVIVDQMREFDPNPSRAMVHAVVRGVIRQYPKSFADITKEGGMVGDGCASLLQQAKNRVEYKNRGNSLNRRRLEKRARTSEAEKAGETPRGPVDQYGCIRWRPQELPEGESEETLLEKKTQLKNIYSREGMSGAEKGEALMKTTFIIQRRLMTMDPAPQMAVVKDEWPLIFSIRCLLSHFFLLTDVAIVEKLIETLSIQGTILIRFCQAELTNRPEIVKALSHYQPETSDKAACVLVLLLAYFKEEKTELLLETEVSCYFQEKGDLYKRYLPLKHPFNHVH